MPEIPRLPGFDHTIDLFREGYPFLLCRFRRLGTDVFQARLLLRKTVCMRGPAATSLFYDRSRFTRERAAPRRLVKTLFGEDGVQTLDGDAHLERKAMFMSLMGEGSIERLVQLLEQHWGEAIGRWQQSGRVRTLVAFREVLTRAVCEWAAVPLPENQVERRSAQLGAIVDASGGVGPRYWRGRLARRQTNVWLAGVIVDIRNGRLSPPPGSAAHVVAWHREAGRLLEPKVAAVELNNVLRPIVAINRYMTFAALALHEHRDRLERRNPAWNWADSGDVEAFVHEVRRYYPFFPFLAARVRESFEWRGYRFPRGRTVMLDIYGTNHDEHTWVEPDRFMPERFRGRDVDRNRFIPQGGGDPHRTHSCAGERLTIAVMAATVRILTERMTYRVPEQDLRIDCGRMPTQPKDGFWIDGAMMRPKGRSRATCSATDPA